MIDAMPRNLDKNVIMQRTRHGKVVFYFRVGKGSRIRLPDPGSPEYPAAYHAALTGRQAPVVVSTTDMKSLGWLIDRYRESSRWASLSVATRKQQGLFFQKAVERSGTADFRAITTKHIRAAMEERKATPALANNFLKAMRGLFQWAVLNDHLASDPTAGVERRKYKTNGFPVWSADDMSIFCQRWPIGSQARLAFELVLLSGVRRSDLVRAGRQHMAGNIFTIKTVKTGATVTIEFSPHLVDVIAATPSKGLHFLSSEIGKPFSVESFGNWFRDRCREAGVMKSAHGIRKLSATMAANAGATTHELMAHYGWSTTQQAEVYTKGADRARLGLKSSRMVAEQIKADQAPHLTSGEGFIPNNTIKTTLKK